MPDPALVSKLNRWTTSRARAETPTHIPETRPLDGVSVLRTWAGVKRKAQDGRRRCSGRARWDTSGVGTATVVMRGYCGLPEPLAGLSCG